MHESYAWLGFGPVVVVVGLTRLSNKEKDAGPCFCNGGGQTKSARTLRCVARVEPRILMSEKEERERRSLRPRKSN